MTYMLVLCYSMVWGMCSHELYLPMEDRVVCERERDNQRANDPHKKLTYAICRPKMALRETK